MRLKTYIATYLLFLGILFSSVGIVSVYLTNSQIDMLRQKGSAQFGTITASLARDISVIYGRAYSEEDFRRSAIDNLFRGYATYYSRHNVYINLSVQEEQLSGVELTIADQFIHITGSLPPPFGYYLLEYRLDISTNMAETQSIRNTLLLSTAIFSVIAAFSLHYILSFIFTDKLESQIKLLEKELASKQQFVDNFAHEIRTPLTSIYGYAAYLQKAQLDENETIESAEYIMGEASHMREIANSLLELSTLRHYVPVKSKISISRLFDDVINSLHTLVQEHDVKIDCRINTDIILGQEDLIKSLLLNLCSNAIKADSSEIILEAEKQHGSTIISVSDNGCGIPADSLLDIMEPFYRVDKSRNRDNGGVGLGLTLCRQIAQVHNAEIDVESAIRQGTTVTITFTTS